MSGLYDWEIARQLAVAEDVPFDALIMAAMRRADEDNLAKLQDAWPELADEMDARFHAPAGRLDEDGPEAS